MLESILRKTVSVAELFMGLGYVLPNIATVIMLNYSLSQYPIESPNNIYMISGILLFILASILLIVVGGSIAFSGIQCYVGNVPQKTTFLGILLSSFYLICLGTGSALIVQEVTLPILLLIASAILIIASTTVYMAPSFRLKFVASLLGIVSGVLLVTATVDSRFVDLVFNWNIPFPGPFMSLAVMEGLTIILAAVTALIYSISSNRENPTFHAFLSMVALVYGIGVIVGSLVLSLNLLNLIWKAPWPSNPTVPSPLFGQPNWVLNVVIFWVASLGMLVVGGIVLILAAWMGFILAAKRFSQL